MNAIASTSQQAAHATAFKGAFGRMHAASRRSLIVERRSREARLDALAAFVHDGYLKRLAIERLDGEPVVGSQFESLLAGASFRPGPRRMTLSA